MMGGTKSSYLNVPQQIEGSLTVTSTRTLRENGVQRGDRDEESQTCTSRAVVVLRNFNVKSS